METWDAQSIRFTSFATQETVQVNPEKWWESVTDALQPLRVEYRPKAQQLTIEGIYNEGRLTLEILNERLDWKWQAIDHQDDRTEETALSSLGTYSEKIDEFKGLIDQWFSLDNVPQSSRIAFGTTLLLPVTSRKLGYETLQHYLPDVKISTENSSDFLYQINRSRDVDIDGKLVRINRLMKWSVAFLQLHRLTISAGSGPRYFGAAPALAVRLELDINTAPLDHNEFNAVTQRTILERLVNLAREIAVDGDVP